MTLKELVIREKELYDLAGSLIDSLRPRLQPIDEEIDRIKAQILAKVQGPAMSKFSEERKDAGTVNLTLDGVAVKCVIDKSVKWDQPGLEHVAGRIREAGDNPLDFIEVTYGITENRFKNFPEAIQRVFLPYRAVKTGKPKYEYKIMEEPATSSPPVLKAVRCGSVM